MVHNVRFSILHNITELNYGNRWMESHPDNYKKNGGIFHSISAICYDLIKIVNGNEFE